jgi:hypothetical protein
MQLSSAHDAETTGVRLHPEGELLPTDSQIATRECELHVDQ